MAIKRTSSNSISNAVKLSTGFSSAAIPNSPTIGTATATSDVAATVTYTAAVLGATGSTFTATSNPGSVTGTGSSPITVTGLTASTAYTFTVTAGNANGTSAASSASNSVTTSAPSGSYQSIATVTVGASSQASISFTSIPATYKHLQIRGIARKNGSQTGAPGMSIIFNDDDTNSYTVHYFQTDAGIVYAYSSGALRGNMSAMYFAGGGQTANVFAPMIHDVLDYANTNKYKTLRSFSGPSSNVNAADLDYILIGSGAWHNTSAITKITITGNDFVQYSQFALYGIKGE